MLEKKNCFNCKNARPVEIQYTSCICKAGKGTKVLDNYWVDAANIKNCDKWKKLRISHVSKKKI